jgi:two-component system cell cycle sensor histidine kinase/response regulator CckA
LYTSGYTENVVLLGGIKNDGLAFLQKPYSPVALLEKVREVLDPAD